MKILSNTLKPVVERWDDPGDYPSGAGSGPLPSEDYVEYIDGQIVVEIDPIEWNSWLGEPVTHEGVRDWLCDNPGEIDHDVSGLTVKKWSLDKLEGNRATLSVEEFECEPPEPPKREYDYTEQWERRERREARDIEEMRAGD